MCVILLLLYRDNERNPINFIFKTFVSPKYIFFFLISSCFFYLFLCDFEAFKKLIRTQHTNGLSENKRIYDRCVVCLFWPVGGYWFSSIFGGSQMLCVRALKRANEYQNARVRFRSCLRATKEYILLSIVVILLSIFIYILLFFSNSLSRHFDRFSFALFGMIALPLCLYTRPYLLLSFFVCLPRNSHSMFSSQSFYILMWQFL